MGMSVLKEASFSPLSKKKLTKALHIQIVFTVI